MRRSILAAILAAIFVVLGVRAGSGDPREAGAEREPSRRENGGTLWPSDHYGVLAELALPRP